MKLSYTAKKIPGVFLSPLFDRQGCTWQAHHVTNPAAFRLTGEERVLLGYRAGGDRDHFVIRDIDVYTSSLGLAVLNEDGTRVVCRFPYPILWQDRPFTLPQTPEEYEKYVAEHERELAVMHDFRIYVHGGYVYVNYHDGTVQQAFDRLCRMEENLFRHKVDEGIRLARGQAGEKEWKALWKLEDWEKLGVDEERHLFAGGADGYPTKTDVTYFETDAGVEMLRRPIPDISRLSAPALVGTLTPDGFDELGVIERCVRPGKWDNSHIGPNAMSTPAHIGPVPVYIDVWHGVHNGAIGRENVPFQWDMYYSPFFSIRDARSGDPLYWSEEPIVDPDDEEWSEYTRHGRWIQALTHTYILFAGGQVPMEAGRDDEDAPFTFYAGAGDTAIVRGEFTIRSLTPPRVLEDILAMDAHRAQPCCVLPESAALKGTPAGWHWLLRNDAARRCLMLNRTLPGVDSADHPFLGRPGYFDADVVTFGGAVALSNGCYAVLYRGARWEERDGKKTTSVGFGLLLLDAQNPERMLYRSAESICEPAVADGFVSGQEIACPVDMAAALRTVPEPVEREIRHMRVMIEQGTYWKSHHTTWLEKRSQGLRGAGEKTC